MWYFIFMEGSISGSGQSSPLFWLFFSLQRCTLPCICRGSWEWFSIAPGPFRVSGFLWHCSKWACQFVLWIFSIWQDLKWSSSKWTVPVSGEYVFGELGNWSHNYNNSPVMTSQNNFSLRFLINILTLLLLIFRRVSH